MPDQTPSFWADVVYWFNLLVQAFFAFLIFNLKATHREAKSKGDSQLAGGLPTINSGELGVKFVYGVATDILAPGKVIINLPPFVQTKIVRTLTSICDLPKQRLIIRDNTVWEIDAGFSYKIVDPIAALTRAANYQHLISKAAGMVIAEEVKEAIRSELKDKDAFDVKVSEKLRPLLARWGIELESIWITSVAPSDVSLEVTQLKTIVQERLKIFQQNPSVIIAAHNN